MERISMHLRVLINQPFLPQDLTQYNTAHNRQISMVGIQEDERPRKRRYRANSVSFSDQEEIINPGTCLCVRGVCLSVVGWRGYKIRMPFGCKLAIMSSLTHHTEDIDPSVGKFRNMVQTTIVPTKVRISLWLLFPPTTVLTDIGAFYRNLA